VVLPPSFSPDAMEVSVDRKFESNFARSEKEGFIGVGRGPDDSKASGISSWPPVFIFIFMWDEKLTPEKINCYSPRLCREKNIKNKEGREEVDLNRQGNIYNYESKRKMCGLRKKKSVTL
jgi:hypothetical protein